MCSTGQVHSCNGYGGRLSQYPVCQPSAYWDMVFPFSCRPQKQCWWIIVRRCGFSLVWWRKRFPYPLTGQWRAVLPTLNLDRTGSSFHRYGMYFNWICNCVFRKLFVWINTGSWRDQNDALSIIYGESCYLPGKASAITFMARTNAASLQSPSRQNHILCPSCAGHRYRVIVSSRAGLRKYRWAFVIAVFKYCNRFNSGSIL